MSLVALTARTNVTRRFGLAGSALVSVSLALASCGTASVTSGTARTRMTVPRPQADPYLYPSPARVQCGNTFLGEGSDPFGSGGTALAAHFGFAGLCFRFSGADTWIVVFSGDLPNPAWTTHSSNVPDVISAPFGGMAMALDRCAPNDSTCLSPTTFHPFSDFLVYRPPYWPAHGEGAMVAHRLEYTSGTALLTFAPGGCAPLIFDLNNGLWYTTVPPPGGAGAAGQSAAEFVGRQYSALMHNDFKGIPRFANQFPPLSGNQALLSGPPGPPPPQSCPATTQ